MAVKKKVTIRLDAETVRQLDLARELGVSRSEFIEAMIELADWSDAMESLRYPEDESLRYPEDET